jgi:hypothetical protein
MTGRREKDVWELGEMDHWVVFWLRGVTGSVHSREQGGFHEACSKSCILGAQAEWRVIDIGLSFCVCFVVVY